MPEDLGSWLAREAAGAPDLGTLYSRFCERLLAEGLPIWRSTLALETLHPEDIGSTLVWTEAAVERLSWPRGAGILTSPTYLASPLKVVDETGRPFRRRLDGPPTDMPVLEELRADGATDYVLFPLPFLDRTIRSAAMSFASRRPEGFADATLERLEAASGFISPYAERVVLRRIATDLLAAYLGASAGGRVFVGQVDRGDVRTLEAALWCCDLRGFTAMSERIPQATMIAILNRWFEAVGGPVEDCGGEVLKFLGDGFLAVFPVAGDAGEVCDRVLDAAADALARTAALNAALAEEGLEPLRFGLALHLGEVAFGNVGMRRRLDFTVIGPAVNHASRIQELTRTVGSPVLASSAFAAAAHRPMLSVGSFPLRGEAVAAEVWAPLPAPQVSRPA